MIYMGKLGTATFVIYYFLFIIETIDNYLLITGNVDYP
jgi:hypothetical protein